MRLLFLSSSVGLGHIVRDVYLSRFIGWANVTWITSGISLKYLEARKVKIHPVSYDLEGLDRAVEDLFYDGRLKIGIDGVKGLYHIVKRNAYRLAAAVDFDDYDGLVADEFWEILLMDNPSVKSIFITDFLRFKPNKSSVLQLLIIPYLNRSIYGRLRRFSARIYCGLKALHNQEFEFYGQIFTHDYEPRGHVKDSVLINLGGTSVGKPLLRRILPALRDLGLKFKVIGSPKYFDPNPLNQIFSSNLIICMAGYSSLIEISRFRKRAIIIPLAGDFEHIDNAEVFRGKSGYRIIPSDKLERRSLIDSIENVLKENPEPPIFKDGSEMISERIKSIL